MQQCLKSPVVTSKLVARNKSVTVTDMYNSQDTVEEHNYKDIMKVIKELMIVAKFGDLVRKRFGGSIGASFGSIFGGFVGDLVGGHGT
jgi:hypothetical protein